MGNIAQDEIILEHTKTLKVLCVEDEKSTQVLYKLIFKGIVKELVIADNGEDGYNKYLEGDIDIIVSDYQMPVLDGLGMAKKIRAVDSDIPIVLVTAIDDTQTVVNALRIGINSFVRKPVQKKELLNEVEKSAKVLIANRFLEEQRNKQLKELQEKESYNSYQEDLGFAKELNILRNDFYYQMIDSKGIVLLDFLYQPLDVMSGDAYSARRINEYNTFYLMVDGMGKGLSASLTAMIITSFVNHIIDKMLFLDDFDMSILINETMNYIQPVLLEEEALAIDFIYIDNENSIMYYSKFEMPALLLENQNKELIRLKSNNPPLCKYQTTFNTDSFDLSGITKFLIYSDGIVENETIYDNRAYADFIEEDFLNAFTREDLKNSFLSKIDKQEDDITLIFLSRLDKKYKTVTQKTFETSLDDVDNANEWYSKIWDDITDDISVSYHACLSFTELFMNAYEHGNLGIAASTKNALMEDDTYFDTLLSKEKECEKNIDVKIDKIEHNSSIYIVTHITDEGEGFDTQILSEIFRNSETFNGRGVFVSRKNSSGIYYNNKGNSVLFLNRL